MIRSISVFGKKVTACALASAFLLAACSGGGGDPAGSAVQAVIVTQSQSQALVTAQNINGNINAAASTMAAIIIGYPSIYGSFTAGSGSTACSSGGTLTISVTDSDTAQAPDAGDSITFTYSDCSSNGSTANGSITYTWNSATNDPNGTATWSANYTENWQSYTTNDQSGQLVTNGTATYNITSTNATQKSMTLTFGNLTYSDYAGIPGAYALTDTLDFSGQVYDYAVDSAGTTSVNIHNRGVTTLANSAGVYDYTFTSVAPFTYDPSGNPTGGAVNVTAHLTGFALQDAFTLSNSATSATINVKWTITSATSAKLESDLDGNGSYETSYTFDLSQL